MSKRIALLYGGAGREHDVSVMGYKYVSSLLGNTDYDILPVYISREGKWHIGAEDGIEAQLFKDSRGGLKTRDGFIKIDAVIPLLHGDGGEDGALQGALDTLGIPYVGADSVTSAVCIDKFYAKCIAESLGIPTVESVVFSQPTDTRDALEVLLERLGLPIFIKPRRLGSSVGAYPVYTNDDFVNLFPLCMKDGANLVIAERLLQDKRELECAFYEIDGERRVSAPGEIIIDGFYGYGEKYNGKTQAVAVADIDRKASARITEYALTLANALSLRHLGRIDFFLSGGRVLFNEVNTFPGFTSESLYPRMLEASGICPRDAILSFVKDAIGC